jgi:RNA polymerase sigma-70 factor (ECF subfamily)
MTQRPDSADPASLICSIAATGDRSAFAALFDHFAPRIKSYLIRTGSPRDTAEELAQETLLMVWRKARLYDPDRAGAAAWIFAIARNLRLDAARRNRPALPEPETRVEPWAPPDAEVLLGAAQRAERLHAALATLPAEQAQVLRLSFFDDRPHAEIESALGIPLGTVKSRLRLAMAKLRALLDDLP